MNQAKYLYPLISLISLCSADAYAQDTTKIATKKVEVVKNYEAIIQQASRKVIPVSLEEKEPVTIEYNYKMNSKARLDFERPAAIVRPISYKTEQKKDEDIKDGSIYGGYGNYQSLNLGAAYHYYIEDWIDAGFKVDHFSAEDSSLPFQKYNDTDANAYASYYLTKNTKAGIDVNYGQFSHFTPFTTAEDSLIATEQSFNNLGGALSLSSYIFEKAGISFRSRLSYDILNQEQDDTRENMLEADLNFLKKISDNISLELPLKYNNYSFKNDTLASITARDIVLRPQLRIVQQYFNAHAGIEFINADSINYIFPIIDINIEDVYEGIDIHLYTSSNYRRNTMHYLSSVNPYYRTDRTTLDLNYLRSYNLAVERDYLNWTFKLRASYNNYVGDDIHFDRSDTNRAIVSGLDRNEWQAAPSIRYSDDIIDMEFSYTRNFFLGNNKNILYYRPESVLALNLTEVLLGDKLSLTQNINYLSSRKHAHPSDEDNLLDAFVELNLGLELEISESIGVYARATNVLGSEYALWFNHPVFERQIWGGLRLKI
jgi:hypothetical protein